MNFLQIPKIALFANHDNKQLLEIKDAVKDEGGDPFVFDIRLGGDSLHSVEVSHEKLMFNDVSFDDIKAIHIRCTAPNTVTSLPPVLNPSSYSEIRVPYFREQEYQSVVMSFFEHFERKQGIVINRLTGAYIDHDSKSQFYEKLRSEGFSVPNCLTTNDPDAANKFIKTSEKIVVKPACGVGSTRIVTKKYIDENLDSIKLCPVLLQEQIIGKTIRVHIVGDTVVLALHIISDDTVDSRTNTKEFKYIKLSEEDENKIVSANRFLGLHYSAWDVIIDENGRCFYLDCNPGPYVMWIGKEYRSFVFKQLAKYMITYAKTESIKKASSCVTQFYG